MYINLYDKVLKLPKSDYTIVLNKNGIIINGIFMRGKHQWTMLDTLLDLVKIYYMTNIEIDSYGDYTMCENELWGRLPNSDYSVALNKKGMIINDDIFVRGLGTMSDTILDFEKIYYMTNTEIDIYVDDHKEDYTMNEIEWRLPNSTYTIMIARIGTILICESIEIHWVLETLEEVVKIYYMTDSEIDKFVDDKLNKKKWNIKAKYVTKTNPDEW